MICNSQKSDKLGFSSTWIGNSQIYTFGLEKTKEREVKLRTFTGSYRKQGYSHKTSTSASLTTDMPLTVWITTNCGKFFKRWEYQTTLPASWEACMWVKKQELEPYKEQLTGLKLGKEYSKAIYCHPVYLTSMQTAAAAKSLQSCPTLCDSIDGSPPDSPVPGSLQARTLEWVAISFSNVRKWKVKVKALSRVWLLVTPWTAAFQAPPSMGFSRQEYWSGVPLSS